MTARFACLVVLFVGCSRGTPVAGENPKATSVLYTNARIYTLDASVPEATGLRVENGQITEVVNGPLDAHDGERVIDLAGATIVPGLIDAHGHVDMLGRQMLELDLRGAASLDEVAARLRERAQTVPPGGWIIGYGWDQNLWPGKEFPTHELLDEAAPGRKVWLRRISHAIWVNRAVLEEAGINAKTKSPQGGEIKRRPDGTPTGVLVDTAAELVRPLLPTPTMDERRATLERAMARLASLGLTGVHTMTLSIAYAEALQMLEAEDRVPIRIAGYVTDEWPAVEAFIKRPPDREGIVQIVGVKLYADGALGSRSAAMLEPYSDDRSSHGLPTHDSATLRQRTATVVGAGYQVAIHAIGDAANRQALDVLTPLAPAAAYPLRIEHVQIVAPADLPRFASSGIVASVQPIHAPSDMPWAIERVGWDRLYAGAYTAKTLVDSGALVVLGSDFPIESPNPWLGIHAAVTRQDAHDQPPGGFLPKQALSVGEALQRYCVTPHQAARDNQPGLLRAGAPADFVVIDRDPFTIAPAELRDIKVLRTVVGGREVYLANNIARFEAL